MTSSISSSDVGDPIAGILVLSGKGPKGISGPHSLSPVLHGRQPQH